MEYKEVNNMEPIDERIINVVTGAGMVCCGISLLLFGLMLCPYMNALYVLSAITFCIVAIPVATMLGIGTSVLVIQGVSVALGRATIEIEPCGGN